MDDPGFGLGDTIPLDEVETLQFQAQAQATLHSLAANGMGVTMSTREGGGTWLEMSTVVYDAGFNASTLTGTLNAIMDCKEKVRKVVA